jgi:hypothetical protein
MQTFTRRCSRGGCGGDNGDWRAGGKGIRKQTSGFSRSLYLIWCCIAGVLGSDCLAAQGAAVMVQSR